MDQKASAKVLVLDFGAQYGQLIARRVRDLNVYSEIVPCDISADEIREMNASALILSGGPASVYAEDAPSIDPAIFDLGLPVLGFCYGHQITAVTLGGKVATAEAAKTKEWPLSRELYFFTNGAPNGDAKAFTDFVVSPAGQKIVQETGFVPLK